MPLASPSPTPSALSVISAAAAGDTVVALNAEAGPDRPWISGFALGIVVVTLGALPLVEVDVTTRATGLVRSRTENVDVRSLVTGVVGEVFVLPGENVSLHQPIARIADPAREARLSALHDQAEVQARVRDEWARLSDATSAADEATRVLTIDALQTSWAQRMWVEFATRDEALARSEKKAEREGERSAVLARRGLVSEHDDEAARFAVAASRSERRLATERTRVEWRAYHRDAEALWHKMDADHRQLEEEVQSLVLRAPLDGALLDLISLQIGMVVVAGQVLGSISPADGFRIEAHVPARAAALIHVGQRVQVSFAALPANEWGSLHAHIETIAPDVSRGATEPAFRVTLQPQHDALSARDGRGAKLRKGFVAEVRFQLGRASLLTLLRRKTADWIEGDFAPRPKERSRQSYNPLSRQPESIFWNPGEIGGRTLA